MDFLESFSKYHKIIIISGIFLALISFIDKVLVVGAIFVVFLSSLTLFFIDKLKDEKDIRLLGKLFLIVFLIHIIAVLFIYYTGFQPFSGGRGDYRGYNLQGQEIASRISFWNFSLGGFSFDHYYPVVVGYIYFLTVPSILMGQLFNAWIVALTTVFVYLIVRQLGGSAKQGFVSLLITSFYPALFFYGSLLLKDALVVFFSTLGLFFTINLIKNFSFKKFAIFYIILIGLTHFRFYIGYTLIFTFIVSWFLFSNLDIKKRLIYGFIIIFLMGFIPDVAMLGIGRQGYFGSRNIKIFSNPLTIADYREQGKLSYYSQFQPKSATEPTPTTPILAPIPTSTMQGTVSLPANQANYGNSSINIDTTFDGPVSFFKNISRSFVYVVLGPFPWQLTQRRHLFALIEMIPWYFLIFFIVKGITHSIKRDYRTALPLVIFCLVIIGILSFYINNFGVITRIRMPAFVTLFCFFPLGPRNILELILEAKKWVISRHDEEVYQQRR